MPVPQESSTNAENLHVLGAALVAGLYPKILTFDASGGLRTITNQQPVSAVSLNCLSAHAARRLIS